MAARAPYRTLEELLEITRNLALRYLIESGLDPAARAFVFAMKFLLRHENNQGTVRRYGPALRRYFKWCRSKGLEPTTVVPSDAALYRTYLQTLTFVPWGKTEPKRLEGMTWSSELAAVKAYYGMLFKDGEIRANPFADLKISTKPKHGTPAFTIDDIDRVLDKIVAGRAITAYDQRDYALIVTGSRVGPRRKELRGLRWQDLPTSVRGDRLVIAERKGGEPDEIDLPVDVRPLLMEWKRELAALIGRPVRDSEPVFPSIGVHCRDLSQARRGHLLPMSLQSITDVCHQRFAEVGLTDPRSATHALRATAVTVAFENGATIADLMIMGGWKSEATCWRYIKRLNRRSPAATWALAARPFPTRRTAANTSESGRVRVSADVNIGRPETVDGLARASGLFRRVVAMVPAPRRRSPAVATEGAS
jgi:integrase